MSSRSPAEISFNGADFEQTNRFPSQYHSSCHRAFVYRYARSRECIRTFASAGGLFRSRTVEADSATAPSASSVLSLHPLDCIDHRWRGCTRRKRLVYSSVSYRYVNGESRSRWDHTCIRGPRVHFPHAVTNVWNYPFPFEFAKQFVGIESWSVRFRSFPTSTRALNANK